MGNWEDYKASLQANLSKRRAALLEQVAQKSDPLGQILGGLAAGAATFVGMPWLASTLGGLGGAWAGLGSALELSGQTQGAGLAMSSLGAAKNAYESGKVGDSILGQVTGGLETGYSQMAKQELNKSIRTMYPETLSENDIAKLQASGVKFKNAPANGYYKVNTDIGTSLRCSLWVEPIAFTPNLIPRLDALYAQ